MKTKFFKDTLNDLEQSGLKRALKLSEGSQAAKLRFEGREVLNFCSNNYLGLADDDRLKQAAIDCIKTKGYGSGAARLICGNMIEHELLEKKVAKFKGAESAVIFSTGYMANVGIISSLFGRDDVIFADRLNHASILDGIQLSQAKMKRYPHCDMDALEEMIKNTTDCRRKAIITDSVFSMDGDLAPLEKIVELAERYECLVMIDEAHALGVMGKKGEGLAHHLGLQDKIDIQMGTFSKAAGSFGAYCCGNKDLIEYLVNKARSFVYTTGMPPSQAAAAAKAIEIIEDDSNLREQLWDNTHYLSDQLKDLGFKIMNSQTPIIPILVEDSNLAVEFSKELFNAGILVGAIRPPTVPHNTARLRLTVMATHTREDLKFLLQQLERIGKNLCIISKPVAV